MVEGGGIRTLAEVELDMMEFFETYDEAQRARMAFSLLRLIRDTHFAARKSLENLERTFPGTDWRSHFRVHIESMDRLFEEAQRVVARAADDD